MTTSPLPIKPSTSNQILIKSTSTSTTNQINEPTNHKSPIKEHEIQTYNLTHQLLPHSNIYKLMKQSLPNDRIKISNSSKTLIQSCVSEFLIFILSHSNSLLSSTSNPSNKRKTITGLDVLNSLKRLGFYGYFNVLKIYLIKYRSIVNQNNHKKSIKSQPNPLQIQSEPNTTTDQTDPRPTKRIKLTPSHITEE